MIQKTPVKPDVYLDRQKTEAALKNIKKLPLIPKVMFEVTKLLQDPGVTTNQLANLIGKDQGLTTKVLSISNSPLYGLQRKVTSLEFAIIVLGYKEISDIITAISLSDAIRVKSDRDFNQEDFWVHSMVVGAAAKGLSQNLGFLDIGSDAFVAGVIHEMGIQIIHNFMHPQYLQIIDEVENHGLSYTEAEMKVLGLTHQQAGRFLAESWNLPVLLCDALNYHHSPSSIPGNKALVSVVHLADYMSKVLHIGSFSWDDDMQLDESIIKTLQFNSREHLEKMILEYKDMFAETAASIRI